MKQAISLLLALALVLSLGLVTGLPVMAGSTTWYVVEGGTGNQTGQDWDHAFGTIQAGINASGSDDTVMVGAGTYAEAVVIDKTLTLLGAKHGEDARTRDTASGESIIQVPNPDDDSAFAIAADGVTVDGFQIADARVGVHVNAVDVAAVVVRNTHVQNAGQDGINLWRATTAVVEYNLVQNAETSGITGGRTTSDWTGALQVTIRNNEVVNAQYGITGFLKDSVIKGNLVMDYEYEGAGIGGQFLNTMIEDNTVSGYSWGVGVGFRAYPPRPSSEKVRVEGNTLTENYAGIYVHESQTIVEITVNFNDIADNIVGGVVNEAAETLNVRYNWWGHETGPDHDGLNLGGQGDAVSDDVHIGPWLYRPQEQFVSDAPCYAGSVLLANEATKATADNATSYYGGWNSFSTPVTLDSSANRVSDLLDLAEENGLSIVRAQRFDAETQSWVAIIMDDEALDEDYTIEPGEGFFIQVSQKGSLPILVRTDPTMPPRRDLVAGWNLVGMSSLKAEAVTTALSGVDYSFVLSAKPPNAEAWSVPPDEAGERSLHLGEAYWVAMGEPGILYGITTTPVQDDMTWDLNQLDE